MATEEFEGLLEQMDKALEEIEPALPLMTPERRTEIATKLLGCAEAVCQHDHQSIELMRKAVEKMERALREGNPPVPRPKKADAVTLSISSRSPGDCSQ